MAKGMRKKKEKEEETHEEEEEELRGSRKKSQSTCKQRKPQSNELKVNRGPRFQTWKKCIKIAVSAAEIWL